MCACVRACVRAMERRDGGAFVAIYDLETQDLIARAPGQTRDEKVASLQLSCCSVLCVPSEFAMKPEMAERAMETAKMHTFWRDGEGDKSVASMIRMFDNAELIVGFNLVGFDWLVLKKHYLDKLQYIRHREKTHDIFSRIRDVTGVWYKLDNLLKLNNLGQKTANGFAAITMWERGERDDLQLYCESDTRQTARLGLLKSVDVGMGLFIENNSFGIASALASKRFSASLFDVYVTDAVAQNP